MKSYLRYYGKENDSRSICSVGGNLDYFGLVKNDTLLPIYINEVAASNGSAFQDEDGEYVDWIELYNDSEESISLKGFGLSDQKEVPKRWEFPDIVMEPKSYLIVCASGKDRSEADSELHTNFKISSTGESIYLSDANGKLISGIKIEEVDFDKSYGRVSEMSEYAALATPTPGEENVAEIIAPVKETGEIDFSHPAGYYHDTVFLNLETDEKDAEIYYTLDGSVPDLQSNQYTGEEIIITDRSSQENRYTEIWCTPVDFWNGDGNTYDPALQYKATVLKARMYFPEDECWSEKVWTSTYLIGADYTMPIMSLSVSEELLFDEQNGIYVPGKELDAYGSSVTELPQDARLWRGNYSEDTEVLGYLEYFEDGQKTMENEITLRICGAASRGNAQKSIAVYAWSKENQSEFLCPVFGEEYENLEGNTIEAFSSLRLRAFGNDWRRSMFRDALSQALAEDLNLGTQGYQPCILLVNGEYFGVYEIRENRDEKFFEEHFGIREGNLIKTEIFGLTEENADENGKDFLEMVSFAKKEDLSLPENYSYMESKLDIEQFIDYMIVEQYLYNVDWPSNNTLAFKSLLTRRDSEFVDGRWRFVLYDLDYAINYPSEDNFEIIKNSENYVSILLRALLNNESFREKYVNRFEELLETYFEPSRALEILEAFENEFAPEIEETLKRWNVYQADGSVLKEVTTDYWYEKMEDLKEFFVERPEYARKYFYSSIY